MPPRSRRRRGPYRARRRYGSRRPARLALGGAAAVLLAGTGVLLNDVLQVRRALADVEARFAAAQVAFARGEIEVAEQRLAEARAGTADVDARTNRLLWQAAERVPLAGGSLRIVTAVVDVADAAAKVGHGVVGRAGGVLGQGGGPDLRVSDGRVALAPLRDVGDALDGLGTDRLEAALAELDAVPTAWVPAQLKAARRRALHLGDRAVAGMEGANSLLDALPGFLGDDRPRRYFLAMQNNAELRGTGGLIGLFSVLTVDDGAFALSEPQVYGVLDRDPEEPDEPLDPVPTADDFAARYAHVNAAGFFANVNVDPDLPTTARVLLDLYAKRTGERLDGVVVLDPVGLGMLLEPVGPVAVPPDVAHPHLPNPVPPGQVAAVTMVGIYDAFGDDHAARRAWLKAFAVAAFDRVFAGSWDAAAVGRRAATAAEGGHLQLFSEVDGEQAAFEQVGLAGAMRPQPGADMLAVTANNAGGNKMDVHVGHSVSATVRLGPVGEDGTTRRDVTVRVEVDNPLPAAGRPDYIIGSCLLDLGRRGCHQGPPGLNRTWFTVWAPATTEFATARDADGDALLLSAGRIRDEHAIDHYLETPAESVNGFDLDLSGPVQLTPDGDDLVYRLVVRRQAKAVPDRLNLDIRAPQDWRPAEVGALGGGDGAGLGVHGEPGPPLVVSVKGDRVSVAGDVNADVHLSVRFVRSGSAVWERAAEWLREPAF